MDITHRRRRTLKLVFTSGFRAGPAAMTTMLMLSLVDAVAIALTPLGFALFTNSLADPSRSELVTVSVLVVGTIGVTFAAGTTTAMAGNRLRDRVSLYMSVKTADLVNATPGIEQFERPDYLRELDLLNEYRDLVGNGPRLAVNLLRVSVTTVITVLLLGSIEPLFVFLPVVGLAPFLATRASVQIRQRTEERLAEERRLANQLFELTTAAASGRELRVYGLAPELQARHAQLAEVVTREVRHAAVTGAALATAGWLLLAAAFIATIITVVVRATNGDASVGDVVLVVTVGQSVGRQVIQMAEGIGQLLTTVKAAHRYLWLEDYARQATRTISDLAAGPTRLTTGITLDDVSFTYPGTAETVLDNVSLRLPAGSTVALVGENGAGKTTLVKLLTRMYEPTSGSIRVDDTDLADIPADEWRRRVTVAFQDFARYEFLARETVGVGDLPRVNDDSAVVAALHRARSHDIVNTLDDGLDTRLGRSFIGGREISGGQWQKLALARGMMRDEPLLLVFDEPTASLDAPTEHALFEQFASAAGRASSRSGAITLLVSHRFSTVRMADLIVVVDEGRVVESGTHTDLMEEAGTYAQLYALQPRAYT